MLPQVPVTKPFHYSTTYKLDKSHFSETYDESSTIGHSKSDYYKSITILLLGAITLFFTTINPYIAWFFVAWGMLEALSIRFHKPWWLARQMISQSANSELTLTIDEGGVKVKSFYVDSAIGWDDLTDIKATQKGWLLHHKNGRTYLSNRCLSEAAKQFIGTKSKQT